MRFMRPHTLIATFAILSAAAGCSGTGVESPALATVIPPAGTPNSVVLTNDVFTPGTLNTSVGSTVTWTWNSCTSSAYGTGDGVGTSTSCVSHTVTFDDGSPGSVLQSSGTFARKFTAAGTYTYHCAIHGSAMTGSVVVQ
jgi:plastocyanin